jgi:8-oxo-dGTP diphosphatase
MDNNREIVTALKGIIINNGKVLIVKRSANSHVGGGTWECVGGKVEFGERLEESLCREAKEEVGLEIIVEKIVYATTFKTSVTRQVVIITYLCRSDSSDVVLSEEHSDYMWATKKELIEKLPENIVGDFLRHQIFEMPEIV